MTLSRASWVKNQGNVGVTAADARRAQGGLLYETTPGVVRSGLVSTTPDFKLVVGTDGLNYDVVAFPAFVIGRAADEGAYIMSGQGTTRTGNVPAAPGTGLSRWDLIYLKQNDLDKSDPDNNPVLGVAVGQAAASPTKPTASVPAGAVVVAEARIYAGTTATNQAPNTITQVWRYTAMKGVPIPVRNKAERDEIPSPNINTRVMRLDLGADYDDLWNGTRWVASRGPRHAEFTGSIYQQPSTIFGVGKLTRDDTKTKPAGDTFYTAPVDDAIFIPEEGSYNLHVRLRLDANVNAGQTVWASLRDSSNNAPGTFTEYDSYDFPAGYSAGSISMLGLVVPPGGMNVYIRFWTTQAGLTLSSRIRVDKVN